jgi:hypothetical protein
MRLALFKVQALRYTKPHMSRSQNRGRINRKERKEINRRERKERKIGGSAKRL